MLNPLGYMLNPLGSYSLLKAVILITAFITSFDLLGNLI